MNNNLNGWFKYHREEAKSFKEAFYLRNESKIIYEKWKKELDAEKERLFKSQDFGNWKTRPEDIEQLKLVQTDATEAFKYILPDKTREVEYKQEEYEYFTQQIYNEFRRTTMGDYAQAREVFVDMGEQMSRYIYNVSFYHTKIKILLYR